MPLEGVDYSATANGDWAGLANAIKAAGKSFAVRYVVGDLSPSGRGIAAAEYAALTGAGIEVVAVYEGAANRMQGGLPAGQADAAEAQAHLAAAGMPHAMPIYFASDWDATPQDQVAIDAYLKGAGSVIGPQRVGLYGGYWPVTRSIANKSAAWWWQTTAWSGGQQAAGIHLFQYAYSQWIGGVNTDATRALQDNYGQASRFIAMPTTTPAPKPVPTTPAPKPKPVVYAPGLDSSIAKQLFGSFKASTGVTISYTDSEELSSLWLSHGAATASYPKIVGFQRFQDSPSVARSYWLFEGGYTAWRENDQAAIKELKSA